MLPKMPSESSSTPGRRNNSLEGHAWCRVRYLTEKSVVQAEYVTAWVSLIGLFIYLLFVGYFMKLPVARLYGVECYDVR
jgi:hypothetical protein